MDKRIGVMIVDDSAFMRKTISDMVEASSELYVAGKARNGLDALEKIKRLKPDVVTLDIEMPKLDGLDTLRRMMEECPTPVMMISNGAESTLEAFDIGAVDFVVKEDLVKEVEGGKLINFHQRITAAANAKLPVSSVTSESKKEERQVELAKEKEAFRQKQKMSMIVIGSSTGGPAALQKILTRFPEDFPLPILIIQHMPPGFTKPLAERFNSLCHICVKEAEHNEKMEPGTAYVAPAGLQTAVQEIEGHYQIKLKISAPVETLYKPSVDVALLSIAPIVKDKLLAVILTGMGDDGLRGCKRVKQAGGTVLSESEETCIVYGMPKVVYEAGLADKQIPLYDVYDQMIDYL
ncbi:protein-glutamate methylesterase/protein-glutamine glutaminase [Pseudobacillus wudalianchiensis]|uniref:Protein-glutamate methylesterase/protein-glutamine glutaminase n=1 Tax=Pseudobacillus wudalianchiensis TaxID=1743143 RepID=A0A1B9ADP2_9BACI|nr:chemotaxis response regulator protein-glutamate methylesterase [Bacillus wudalianchiensis]OCA81954.1 hypothetical protein A8F95_14660 [Bacillus wudalianchiensis]